MLENFGIGTDIELIERFENLDPVANKTFLKKIFTGAELKYCFSKENFAPHLAARFAGKEAVVKALYCIDIIIANLTFHDIEILNNTYGVPTVSFKHSNLNSLNIALSLSHCNNFAIAFAIVVKDRT